MLWRSRSAKDWTGSTWTPESGVARAAVEAIPLAPPPCPSRWRLANCFSSHRRTPAVRCRRPTRVDVPVGPARGQCPVEDPVLGHWVDDGSVERLPARWVFRGSAWQSRRPGATWLPPACNTCSVDVMHRYQATAQQ